MAYWAYDFVCDQPIEAKLLARLFALQLSYYAIQFLKS